MKYGSTIPAFRTAVSDLSSASGSMSYLIPVIIGQRRVVAASHGWVLLAVAAALLVLLGGPSAPSWTTQLLTLTTLVVRILACGVGLARGSYDEGGKATA